MVAKLEHDKGYSVLHHSQFNYGGTVIPAITGDMAREVMDFTIEKCPCMTEDGLAIPRMNYLRRSDGGIVDCDRSVGEEFEVTCQPMETLEFASSIVDSFPGLRFETVATMYNGGTSFIVLSFGDGYKVAGDLSPHYQNIVMVNPCTRGKLHFVTSLQRVVCMNTLQLAMKNGEGYRICHTKNGRVLVEDALVKIRKHVEAGKQLREWCDFLASKQVDSAGVAKVLDKVLPLPLVKENGEGSRSLSIAKTRREEIVNQFETDTSFTQKTYWTLLNAMTYLQEHPVSKQERVDGVQVAFENIVGARANRKAEYLEAVYEVANAA